LLDVGCGVGVPAIRLGQRTDAEVTGITISRWQVAEANRRAAEAGLRGQVRFEYGDASELAYPDGFFDAVMALDALVHAGDRSRWLREMYRVLRPGGRFSLSEFTEEVPLSDSDHEVIGFGAMSPPLPARTLLDLVRDCGFVVDEFELCGDRVRRTYDAYFEQIARRRAELAAAYGEEKVGMYEHGMVPLFDICREKMGYIIVSGYKAA
ncbi:MAG TPA: class I SAM-dependent methyltransferase, partial [Micromonosporaceae bacterium]|nr:class I SAM-dependent methyltransferase [Micromonosporaceae bacterium]